MGVKLADKLGIPFYDKELISMAADDINIAEEAFRHYDEHIVVYDPWTDGTTMHFQMCIRFPCRTRYLWPSPM